MTTAPRWAPTSAWGVWWGALLAHCGRSATSGHDAPRRSRPRCAPPLRDPRRARIGPRPLEGQQANTERERRRGARGAGLGRLMRRSFGGAPGPDTRPLGLTWGRGAPMINLPSPVLSDPTQGVSLTMQFDINRLRQPHQIIGVSAIALFILLF